MLHLRARAKSSVVFLVLYVVLMFVNILVLIWEVRGGMKRRTLLLLEGIINSLLVGEVAIAVCVTGKKYFHSGYNVMDFAVTCLSVVFFLILLEEDLPLLRALELSYANTLLIGARYVFQACRLMALLWRSEPNRRFISQGDVSFVRDAVAGEKELLGLSRQTGAGSDKETQELHSHTMAVLSGATSNARLSKLESLGAAALKLTSTRAADAVEPTDPDVHVPSHLREGSLEIEKLQPDSATVALAASLHQHLVA